mmetsp:Transcript_26049/g.57386  ORF Transcript_26049/g.57386 Transcript_26049/m.57386 type:complete len:157 (-) Transcript_26049:1676-2146(-)
MGCCASSETSEPTAAKKPSGGGEQPAVKPSPVPKPKPAVPAAVQPKPTPVSSEKPKPAAKSKPDQTAQAAPAPGVKHVRAAYKGKGWAPPQKEWESNTKTVGDKTKIEIEDEWDDDGNLKRTITKYITTSDWKKKTEKTVEIIPADEAEKMGLGRK